jgi:hypothetical protein
MFASYDGVVPTKLSNDILAAAIEGFEAQKKRIDDKIAEIRQMLGGGPTEPSVTPEAPVGKRKKFSAAARRKMALGQQNRWAKIKGESEPTPSPVTPEASKAKRIRLIWRWKRLTPSGSSGIGKDYNTAMTDSRDKMLVA